MYHVHVEHDFHAAHAVRLPDGEMEPLHWHRWGVVAVFSGLRLNPAGLLVDFIIARERLCEVLGALEGTDLNDHAFLDGAPASTEHLARRIFEALNNFDWEPARLSRVDVREAPGCAASFSGDGLVS